MVINYKLRIDLTRIYIDKLNNNLSLGWESVYKKFINGELDYVEKTTMLHPDFIKSIHLPKYISHQNLIAQIQGERTFKKENGDCQSELLWGYRCPFEVNLCHGDHLFPYSLGGPTIAGNKLLLCYYHNMVKGIDIHFFPWEDSVNRLSWLDNHINNLANKINIYLNR